MYNNYRILIFSILTIFVFSDISIAQIKMKKKKRKQNIEVIENKVFNEKDWNTNTNIIPSGDPKAKKGGMITMLGGEEYPTTFRSIGKGSRNQINSLLDAIQYETLLSFDYERLEWSPNLATHWKISPDSMTYWFKINENAKFADGQSVTSDDVIATFKLLIDKGHDDPNVASYYNDLFEIPVAESKYIVRITAKKKDWRTFRSAAQFTVMPARYLSKVDGAGYLEKYDFSFMPGSGPYEFDRDNSKKGNEGYIIMKRRDDWWAKNNPANIGLYNFDQIKFIFIEDENQQVISFFNDDYDIYPWSRAQWWVERFNDEKYEQIANGWVQKIKVFNFLPKGPSGIVFNTKKEPFDNVKIRKAFTYMFDVDKLNKRLFFNEYVRLNTYFYGTPYANPRNPIISFSPDEALKLFSEAGWTRKQGEKWLTNDNGDIFEFEFLTDPSGPRIYTTFQEDLKNIGIKMNFKQVDGSAKFSKTMKKEYEVTAQGWTGGFFPSPEGLMHSKYADEVEVTNITSMAYPELDLLLGQYNAEWDAKKRIPIAHQIDSIAFHSFHYAMGWTSPYGARMLYWNKFGMPESGVTYIGDWRTPLSHWWIEPLKESKLINAQLDNSALPKEKENIDFWNRMKKQY